MTKFARYLDAFALLIFGILACLGHPTAAAAQNADNSATEKKDESKPVIIARWHGTYYHRNVSYSVRSPGNSLFLPPFVGSTFVGKAAIVLREERDPLTAAVNTIIESFNWNCEASELQYVKDDGSLISAGSGGSGGGSLSEKDLQGEKVAPAPGSVAIAQQRVNDAQKNQDFCRRDDPGQRPQCELEYQTLGRPNRSGPFHSHRP